MPERLVAEGGVAGLEAVTAFNRPVFQAYAEIVAAVRQRLGDQAASLFARPQLAGDTVAWFTDRPGDIRRWQDLGPAERAAFEPTRTTLDGQLRGLAANLTASGINTREGNLAHVLEAALLAPGLEHLYLVGGQPVLAFWGFRGAGQQGLSPLRAPLPEPPAAPPPLPPPRRGLWPWLLALLALLLLALLTWWFWPRPEPPPPAPAPPTEKVEPAAPPPQPAPQPPPQPPVSQPPPPPPKADIPKSRWDARDLSLLEGCWVLGHDGPAQSYDAQGRAVERGITRAGEICFDAQGNGSRSSVQEFSWGHILCQAPVTTTFDNEGRIVSRQPGVACTGDQKSTWLPRTMVCTRRNDSVADCVDHNPYEDNRFEFRRKE
jgi:hypothetical protein